jgi:hypothetical protein
LKTITLSRDGCNARAFNQLKPRRSVPYADVIQFHLNHALGPRERSRWHECMAEHGGYENLDRKIYYSDEPHWIRGQPRLFRERLRTEQPSTQCLRQLIALRDPQDIYLTLGERSLDLHFPRSQLAQASMAVRRHLISLHHRSKVHSEDNVFYFNPAQSRKNTAVYHDRPSKITREPCVHIDRKLKTHAALVAYGLGSITDWINFDDRSFFAQVLIAMDLDYARLGRLLRNHDRNERRRIEDINDYKIGLREFERYGLVECNNGNFHSIQRYVDRRRKHIDVNSCLIPLPIEHLLPPKIAFTHITGQMHSIPFRHFDPHGMGTTSTFLPSNTTIPISSTTSTPRLGPRPSKLIRLHTWKSLDRIGPLTDLERDHIAQITQETTWLLLLGGQL